MVARLKPSVRRLLAVALPLAALAALIAPAAAQAAIAKVQAGSVVNSSGTSLALTLSSASTAGNLLVATVAADPATATFSGPTGWVRAIGAGSSGTTNPTRVEIWYRANTPGGISSATFTASSATHVQGQLSEWSGVATSSPLDVTGTGTASNVTSVSVSTSSSTSQSGEVGITAVGIGFSSSKTTSFTPGTGWTNLGNDGSTNQTDSYSADYKLSLSQAVASETVSGPTNNKGDWAAAIATFQPAPTCSGGSLTLAAATSTSFSAVTLNGTNQTVSTTLDLTPDDETGSGSGWNVTGTSTTFNNGSGRTLPTTATQVTAASASAGSPNCNLPTNSIAYPVTLPAGSSPPTAVKMYNAAAATGKGQQSLTLTFQLSVPANAYHATYTSTWTFAIVSGP